MELSNARINRFSDVSSPLLLAFGILSLLLYFQLPSTFLPSKGRSITTLGTRWHDFFLLLFLDILQNCFTLYITLFSFSQGMQTRERAHCARSVFPFIKKKRKKIIFSPCNLSFIQLLVIKFISVSSGCHSHIQFHRHFEIHLF